MVRKEELKLLMKNSSYCSVCKIESKKKFMQIDHIFPKGISMYFPNLWLGQNRDSCIEAISNKRIVCRSCNVKKAIEDRIIINGIKKTFPFFECLKEYQLYKNEMTKQEIYWIQQRLLNKFKNCDKKYILLYLALKDNRIEVTQKDYEEFIEYEPLINYSDSNIATVEP